MGSLLEREEGGTHLNSSAEGHLPVSLAEVHVAHAQVCALQENWEVHLSNQITVQTCTPMLEYMPKYGKMRQLLELSVINMQQVRC